MYINWHTIIAYLPISPNTRTWWDWNMNITKYFAYFLTFVSHKTKKNTTFSLDIIILGERNCKPLNWKHIMNQINHGILKTSTKQMMDIEMISHWQPLASVKN